MKTRFAFSKTTVAATTACLLTAGVSTANAINYDDGSHNLSINKHISNGPRGGSGFTITGSAHLREQGTWIPPQDGCIFSNSNAKIAYNWNNKFGADSISPYLKWSVGGYNVSYKVAANPLNNVSVNSDNYKWEGSEVHRGTSANLSYQPTVTFRAAWLSTCTFSAGATFKFGNSTYVVQGDSN